MRGLAMALSMTRNPSRVYPASTRAFANRLLARLRRVCGTVEFPRRLRGCVALSPLTYFCRELRLSVLGLIIGGLTATVVNRELRPTGSDGVMRGGKWGRASQYSSNIVDSIGGGGVQKVERVRSSFTLLTTRVSFFYTLLFQSFVRNDAIPGYHPEL